MTDDVCKRLGVTPVVPNPQSKVGIALQSIGKMAIHGLRHPVEGDTNGWYIWCGEFSDTEDFFQPLHVEHVTESLPQLEKYLSLPPGYRFLIDDEGYEDVWFDESLLKLS
jgi:hypothetical protein